MDTDKTLKIFNKVFELTKNKKIEWKKEGNDSSSFTSNVAEYIIRVYSSSLSWGFQVNSKDAMLGSISKNLLSPVTVAPVDELFEIAKSNAYKIDENLDNLLDNLEKL